MCFAIGLLDQEELEQGQLPIRPVLSVGAIRLAAPRPALPDNRRRVSVDLLL